MNSEDDITLLKHIYASIVDISGVRISQLNCKVAINNDLHIYGDDVDEIFSEINRSYPFSWQTFPFSKYFAEEGASTNFFTGILLNLILFPFRLILWVHSKLYTPKYYNAFCSWLESIDSPRPRTPFTVEHLFAFVKNQTWSENLKISHNLSDLDTEALKRLRKR